MPPPPAAAVTCWGTVSTTRAAFPLEYANAANLLEWEKRLNTRALSDTLRELQRRRTSPNGVFSIKMHYSHIRQFGGFNGVMRAFPNAYYVLLSRKDALRQAISYSIASQTGVWIDGQEAVKSDPAYDFDDIDRKLRAIIKDNASWRYILAANGCHYMEMDYSVARTDIAAAIGRIAAFMRLEVSPGRIPPQPVTKAQSNKINEEWTKRFLADHNGKTLFETDRARIGKLKRVLGAVARNE